MISKISKIEKVSQLVQFSFRIYARVQMSDHNGFSKPQVDLLCISTYDIDCEDVDCLLVKWSAGTPYVEEFTRSTSYVVDKHPPVTV